ncbi:hypothetical protein KR222_003495, partial [Zaprionus bogoriensis]
SEMKAQLDGIQLEDLPYLERDLSFAQKVSLAFLLFGDQHAHASYILQRLLALLHTPPEQQQAQQAHSDLLRQYAHTNPTSWRECLVEALCIINGRRVLRKLGLSWPELRLHYLPHVQEISLHVHPLLKAMYHVCEQLTVVQSGRLVLDINEKLAASRRSPQDEPLRCYDYGYLEIFLLDWLTRRHLRLGDANAVDSDLQLLIEYLKFNDFHSLSRLLIQTYNSNARGSKKCESDDVGVAPPAVAVAVAPTAAPACALPVPAAAPPVPAAVATANGRANALQVRRQHAGILLILNQFTFHRNVSEDLIPLLPKSKLAKREGTKMDEQRLHDVFSALGYTVEAHANVDHLKMLELIRDCCARSVLRDSLIVCILSHGFEGAVYGSDSIPIWISDIQNVLCADESLSDKPKLLIVQACQQKEKRKQAVSARDVNALTNSPIQYANLVLAMSTVPGYVALRHSIAGSWFIQSLCEMVKEHAAT